MDNPIQALVLNRLRYGETSLILRLFTERYGLISGILKGAINSKKWVPEIGSIIETLPLRKRDEGLFILSAVEYEYHYGFADSLIKSAVRDTTFELSLAVLHEEDAHSDLYLLFGKFLHHLESCSESEALFALWLFILRFGDSLGTPCERHHCVKCGTALTEGGELTPEQGGFTCPSCRPMKSPLFSGTLISLLADGTPSADEFLPTLETNEKMGITNYLIENLRCHFEFHRHINSLQFLKEVL